MNRVEFSPFLEKSCSAGVGIFECDSGQVSSESVRRQDDRSSRCRGLSRGQVLTGQAVHGRMFSHVDACTNGRLTVNKECERKRKICAEKKKIIEESKMK